MGNNRATAAASVVEEQSATGAEETTGEETTTETVEEAAAGETTTAEATTTEAAPQTFMDPNNLPPELLAPFKRMQGAFTKAMQGVAGEKAKAELYDQLMSGDPEQAVQALAKRVGLKVVKGEVVDSTTGSKAEESPTVKYIRDIVNEQLAPAKEEFVKAQKQLRAEAAISYLSANHPDWYIYENTMADLAIKHPSLQADPSKLYRLAKAEQDDVAAVVDGGEKRERVATRPSTGRATVVGPKKAETIDEAFAMAKKQHGFK